MVTRLIALEPDLDWLEDDTEESLLGTMWHQRVIVSTVNSLTRYNRQGGGDHPGEGRPPHLYPHCD